MAPLQPYQPDLAGSFARGLQIRELLEAGRDRDRKRRAREAFEAGKVDEAVRIDPELGMALEKSRREADKAELDAANTMQQMNQRGLEMGAKRDDNTRAFAERVANSLQADPAGAARWQRIIDQRTRLSGKGSQLGATDINPFEVPGHTLQEGQAGPQLAPTEQEIEAMRRGAGGKDERTSDQKDFEYGEKNPDFRKYEMTKKKAGAPSTTVSVGNDAATMANRTKLQEGVETGQTALDAIDGIRSVLGRGRFLTYQGRGRALASRVWDKVAPDSVPQNVKDFMRDRTDLFEYVESAFNAYRKDITGAGASVQELERLKNAMLNTDLSPTEFEAALDRYERIIRAGVSRKQKILREGVPTNNPDQGRGEYTVDDFK